MAQPKARYWFKARYSIGEALEELSDEEAGMICKAIWNFAHVDLDLPEYVQVENVHLSDSLMKLSYNITSYNENNSEK